jgi:SAM-dependent methyltransferase
MDIRDFNSKAWDKRVALGDRWSTPVTTEQIAAARRGEWHIVLTENLPIPRAWLGDEARHSTSRPATSPNQARVTVYDNSPAQLAQDRLVAERDGLALATVEGDMRRLEALPDASFDLIVHPVSNLFVPEVRPVWAEAFRVLRPGGALLAGCNNPVFYIFDNDTAERGELLVSHRLPYADLDGLTPARQQEMEEKGWPLEWSHTLTDQIGGQLDAGFRLAGLYEDHHTWHPLARFTGTYLATRALKNKDEV